MGSQVTRAVAAIGVVAATWLPSADAIAVPTTYVFQQTSSNVSDFSAVASVIVNGTLADLPTITNVGNPGPYDFESLLGLNFQIPGTDFSIGLNNFIAPTLPGGYPDWTISPSSIDFLTARGLVAFRFTFTPSAAVTTVSGVPCITVCTANGSWVVDVPEPPSLPVFLFGFGILMALTRKRAVRVCRPLA